MNQRDGLVRPIFIVGCGRSGTTLLGEILERHEAVGYLNEPRRIWVKEPRTDIWTRRARRRGGRLELTAEDVDPATAAAISRAFARRLRRQRGERLVEKLPINSFRIGFIRAIWNDAIFVHLIRDGMAVARSIERRCEDGRWYGHEDYKWRLLTEFARSRPEHSDVVPLCNDNRARGMLEWRLAVSAARGSLERIPRSHFIEMRYESLVADPLRECSRLTDFLDIHPSEQMQDFARATVSASSRGKDPRDPKLVAIGGPLLTELGYLK